MTTPGERHPGVGGGRERAVDEMLFYDVEKIKESVGRLSSAQVLFASTAIAACRGVVYVAGNGGSDAQAQHLVSELVGRFSRDRAPRAAVHLRADTCVANDYGYESVFCRQLEALARPGDIFVGLSTSGKSENIRRCYQVAPMGCLTLSFGGPSEADVPVIIEGSTATIQEVTLMLIHHIAREVDKNVYT